MQYCETCVTSHDSTKLFVRHYQASSQGDSRTLLLIHGMGEHGGRYDHVCRVAVEQGWNVIVPELRGHGLSGSVPMHVRDFRQYSADLSIIREHFGCPPEQMAILGHSLGALVSLRHAQLTEEPFRALVLISPLLAVKVRIPKTTVALGKLLTYVAPKTRFKSRVNPADTTRCQESLQRRAADPLIRQSVTAAWYFAMKAAMARAWNDSQAVRMPVLIMQAGEDRIVDPLAPEQWLRHTSSPDKTFRELSEHLHELLNEPDWPDTVNHIFGWLDKRFPALDEIPAQHAASTGTAFGTARAGL